MTSPTSSSSVSSSSSPTSVRSSLDDNNNNNNNTTSHLMMTNKTTEKHTIQSIRDDDNNNNNDTEDDYCPTTSASSLLLFETRNLIFKLSVLVGNLSSLFLQHVPADVDADADDAFNNNNNNNNNELSLAMAQVLATLQDMSLTLSLDLEQVIRNKMELNARKYPAELCKGKAGKYTEYSQETGITKDKGQSTLHALSSSLTETTASTTSTTKKKNTFSSLFVNRISDLTDSIREFAQERHWSPYHRPRNLLLALLGELGELAELFQFKGDNGSTSSSVVVVGVGGAAGSGTDSGTDTFLSATELDKIGQEIADVAIYLLRLADVCGVHLQGALEQYYEYAKE